MRINKKNLLAVWGATLILGACSNEEFQAIDSGTEESKEVTISLNLEVDGYLELYGRSGDSESGPTDRIEPRQMVNQSAQQSVNDLRIYIFGSDTADGDYTYVGGGQDAQGRPTSDGGYLVSNKEKGMFFNLTPWTGDGNETHNYEVRPRLKTDRYYKFLAVGRDDQYADSITPSIWDKTYPWWFGYKTLKDCNFVVGETKFDEASIEVSRNWTKGGLYEPNYVTEVFSGYLAQDEVVVDGIPHKVDGLHYKGEPKSIYLDKNFDNYHGKIFLSRAVAGIFALITNIPCHVTDDETGLEFRPDEVNLLLSVCSTKTNLVTKKDASEEHFNDIIVGQVDFRYTTVFNPNKWYADSIANRYTRKGTTYKGRKIPDNTTMMSNFIMPVDVPLTDDKCEATLVLQYYTSLNNGHLIRSQKLKCTIVAIDITGDNQSAIPVEKNRKFAIEANKLYVLCEDYDIYKAIDLSKFTRVGENYPVDESKH